MGASQVIVTAAQCFYDYIDDHVDYLMEPRPGLRTPTSVEELIERWLFGGEAVLDCRKDFRIFTSAVAVIFAQWHDYRFSPERVESNYDFAVPWGVTRALREDAGEVSSDIFDPYIFQAQLCVIEESRQKHLLSPP